MLEMHEAYTVGELREALASLPDFLPVRVGSGIEGLFLTVRQSPGSFSANDGVSVDPIDAADKDWSEDDEDEDEEDDGFPKIRGRRR